MRASVDRVLDELARRGSWFGGGSAAALAAALSAALQEKLISQPPRVRMLRAIRRSCANAIEQDAAAFATVVAALRRSDRRAFARALKTATDIPSRIARHARWLQTNSRTARRQVKRPFHSDLVCAEALAQAARTASLAFIETNLAWLGEPAYARRVRRQLSQHATAPARRRGAPPPAGVARWRGR